MPRLYVHLNKPNEEEDILLLLHTISPYTISLLSKCPLAHPN
jgi:hypothetical protein